MLRPRPFCLLAAMLALAGGPAGAGELTESDYFTTLPTVLTVTRLAQPLSETPGAVTIIDRETIRRSGARELTGLLRLVPGYLVGGYNGANTSAVYHAPIDPYGIRNLVLIDGRSVYSTYFLGGTHKGLNGVLLDDIDRIEVLRGSNSAAYGANAMFGVINIVTRHAADTRGTEIAATQGEGGIADRRARIGWGNEQASFRLSTGRVADNGYRNAYDEHAAHHVHFRGDLRLAADQEMRIAAGAVHRSEENGLGSDGNPFRPVKWRSTYLQGEWSRDLSATDRLRLTASHDTEAYHDRSVYESDPSVLLDFGGRSGRTHVELEHTLAMAPDLRAVWGVGYKRETVTSAPLYARKSPVVVHETRLFGNLEWRPHPQWSVNAGAFVGRHNWTGSYISPRLMANFHATPNHSFRIGAARAERTPLPFELAADVRYYPKNVLGLLSPVQALLAANNMPVRTYAATGEIDNERMGSGEIGYFGNFRAWRLTLDMRAYQERMRGTIGHGERFIPGYDLPLPAPLNLPIPVRDFVNGHGFVVRGIEYQLRWKPFADTEIWVNQSFSRLIWDKAVTGDDREDYLPPTRMNSLALFQRLPYGLDLSLMYRGMSDMNWGANPKDALPNRRHVDFRLAAPLRFGSTRAEASLVVQAANGHQPEYFRRQDFKLERRAFGTLRVEF